MFSSVRAGEEGMMQGEFGAGTWEFRATGAVCIVTSFASDGVGVVCNECMAEKELKAGGEVAA